MYYLETSDEKFAIQIGNFGSKLGGYQGLFGLTTSEVNGAEDDAAFYQWIVSNIIKVETNRRYWTSLKKTLKMELLTRQLLLFHKIQY